MAGGTSVEQWRIRRQDQLLGPWGSQHQFRRDSWGRMVNGLNQPVEQKNGRYEVAEVGFSGVFAGRDSREVDAEIERARRAVSGGSDVPPVEG